jgi:predicted DNA-binding protein
VNREDAAGTARDEDADEVGRDVLVHLPSELYEGLSDHADRRRLTVADVLRAAASRHLAYLAVVQDPSTPCDHGNPRGCAECALCRRDAAEPDGAICRQCLRGWPIYGRGSGPVWHHSPTPSVVPLKHWATLRARARAEGRPLTAVVGEAIEHYLDEPAQ